MSRRANDYASPCPTCHAHVGQRCRGHGGEYQDHVHRSRIKLERLCDDSPKTLRSAAESELASSFA